MFCPNCGKQQISTQHHSEKEYSCDMFFSITQWLDRDDMTLYSVKDNNIHTCQDCKTIFVIGEE